MTKVRLFSDLCNFFKEMLREMPTFVPIKSEPGSRKADF